MTLATLSSTIAGMEDEIPDCGDLEGLTRMVRQAIDGIDRMDLPARERQAWIEEIEEALERARDFRGDLSRPHRLGVYLARRIVLPRRK